MSSSYRSRNLRRSRSVRGESLAPALFPFLAVLVCTMGALVLILVLVVSQASASANRPTPADETLLAAADTVHLMSEEMIAQRDRQQQEIEKRRLDLTSIEDHISRLADELEHYREMAQAIDARKTQTESDRDEQKRKAEALESKINLEKEKLAELKKKATGNTPAFAIFPYQGKNGTTRRPIYLECVEAGVIIQPEGTLLSIDDLKPPFGPGNPLDASLRLVRSEFQKLDPTSSTGVSPYPLLLVRPNGIKAYVLARAAMAGWDDQFGYELLDQDMPLAFPPTIPGLAYQLEMNLVIARERQIALSAAMPRRYAGGQPWEEDLDTLDSASDRSSSDDGFAGSNSGGTSLGDDWTAIDSTFVASPFQGTGRTNAQSNGDAQATQTYNVQSSGLQNSSLQNSSSRVSSPGLSGYQNQQQPPPPTQSNATAAGNGNDPSNRYGGDQMVSGSSLTTSQLPGGSSNDSSTSNGSFDSMANSSQNDMSSKAGVSGGTSPYGNPSANASQNSNANPQTTGGSSTSLSQGNSMEPAQPGQDPTLSYSATTGREKAAMNANPAQGNSLEAKSSKGKASNSSTQSGSASAPQSQTKSQRRAKSNQSTNSSMAHNWSSRRQSANSTAVSRPMNLVVMEDRWLVMRDGAAEKIETTITMEKGPIEARNQLFQTITNRVDSWGVAVSEGYWLPKLTIEVTPNAEVSAQRLQKLLEGSELDAEFIPLRPSKR